ncbi:DUF922 domain-containing protein, partial [Psychroserpens mesophilus]|uniref:DUF922 domain-containing protein n=1 Tax=Psychroserpens mesophilus TaxID=325473 RepID=UPI000590D95E
ISGLDIPEMKFFKQIIVFISIWLILPTMMVALNIPYKNLFIIVTPIIFSIYNLIQGLNQEDSELSKKSFVISLLFVLIAIKIEYHFYNWLIHMILIFLGVYIFKPFKNLLVEKLNFLGTILICINLLLLITSNNWILNQLNHEKKPWSTNLEWTDFHATPEENSKLDAIISTGVKYKINKVFNYPNTVISAYMIPNESWNKEISDDNAKKELLNHEKGHFNIVEAHIRFIQDSLDKTWGKSSDKIEKVIYYYLEQKRNAQDKYDSITEHGSILLKQREWDTLIEKWLE